MLRRVVSRASLLGFCVGTAAAGAHTWDVNEVFSNADGTIQFVELWEAAGTPGEIFLNGRPVRSDSLGTVFTINHNFASPSTNRHILLATQSFADLPGAPTPDFIIPAGSIPFFNRNGDTVRYDPYDAMTFPAVPTDGILSWSEGGVIAANSPTNYAGQTGSVDASGGGGGLLGDMNCDDAVSVSDIGGFVLALTNPAAYDAAFPDCDINNGDINDDDAISVSDIGPFVALLTG